jgi:hypothetical protein
MDDFDDLVYEASLNKELSSKLKDLDLNLKQPVQIADGEDWGSMDLKAKKPDGEVDEWGDLKVEAPKIAQKPAAPTKEEEPVEDFDWDEWGGTYETPNIKKNSEKVKQIALKRKEADEEDGWGDII